MAMRREVADLRTTFSVAGVNDVVAGARAAAAGLDAVGSAAQRQARAVAGASAGSAAAAREQAAAAAVAVQAQARLLQASREAAAAARTRYREIAQAAADAVKAEAAASEARAAAGSADLQREIAAIDARMAARKAATEKARAMLAEAEGGQASNKGRQREIEDELSRIAVEKRSANVAQRIREAHPDATAEQRADAEDALHDQLRERSAAARREISELQAKARNGYGIPKLQGQVTDAENAEHDGNADDAASRGFAESRIANIREREAAKVAAVRAGFDARLAAAKAAAEETERLLERQTSATETAAAAQARAVREAAAAEVLARKDAAAAKAQADADAARAAARADVAAQAAADRQAAGGDTAAAVRTAQERLEDTKRGAADRIRREQAAIDDAASARRDANALKDGAEGRALKSARAQAAALQKRLDRWEKENKGRRETPEKEAERTDIEEQLDGWRGTAGTLARGNERDKAGRRRAEEEAQRAAAERLRLVREVEDARVSEAARAVDEIRQLHARETLAAQEAAKAQVEAAKDAARARAKAAADAAAAIDRIAAGARTAADKARARRELDAEIASGMADPAALRARSAAAAADYDAYAAKAKDKLGLSQARVAGARGTDREAEVAEKEARIARGVDAALGVKERAAIRYAAALAEVERRLKGIEAESDRALRTAQAEADRAAASIDRIAAAARRVQGEFKAQASYKVDLDRGLRNPRQTEALAKAWASAYERAVARVVAAAAEAQAAIAAASGNPADAARVAATEQAKVEAAQKAADKVRAQARRTSDVWKEVSRAQVQAAKDAARAQEQAARRSGDAWRSAADRFARIQRSMPTLFGERSLGMRLRTQGALPVIGGALGTAGRVVGGVASVARGVFGVLTGIVGLAGRAGAAVLSVGAAAVTAAGRIVLWLGRTALSTLARLSRAIGATALKLAGLAKTIVIRTVVAGMGAAVGGAALAKKAISDTAEETYATRERSMQLNTDTVSTQRLSAASGAAGVRADDMAAAFSNAKDKIRDIANDPALVSVFTRLNIWTRDSYGRVLDTASVIQTVMQRISTGQLSGPDEMNLLTRLFGSPEAVERILPLLQRMRADSSFLEKSFARKQSLGAVIDRRDLNRMYAFNAAVADGKDAWLGLKLAVSRAVGPYVIQSFYQLSNLIGRNRDRIAALAYAAYDTAAGMVSVLKDGGRAWTQFTGPLGRVAQGLLNATYVARALGMALWSGAKAIAPYIASIGALGAEIKRAVAGVFAQQFSPDQVYIRARRPAILFAQALWYAARGAGFLVRMGFETVQAFRGLDKQVVEFPWLLKLRTGLFAVGRFAREVWRTIRGGDKRTVTEFPWLLQIRSGLEAAGRFAGETWATITGKTGQVTEFPVLLRIRSAVLDTLGSVKEFAREAWQAITGGAQDQQAQFPFLYAAADAVRGFVAEVKATAADLIAVWNGFDPQTWLGEKLQAILQMTDQAGKAWADLKKVFDDKPDAKQQFNFPWIRDLADSVRTFGEHVREAWDTFKGFYDFFDRSIQRMTFGKLDLATVAITTAFLGLFGVTRVVFGGLKGLALAGAGLRRLFTSTAAAAAGSGGAAGLAGALTRTGDAAVRSGEAASRSASLWGRLSSSIGGVVANLARNPGVWALLGIGGGIVGDMVGKNADPENGTGRGWAVAGGVLQGAGTGLMLGAMTGNPFAAAAGAIGGGIYGAFSSNADYNARRLEAVKKQLQDAGHGDIAARITETEVPAGSEPAGLSSEEQSAFGDADREIARAEEGLKTALAPMGQDIAAIRDLAQRGASVVPGASGEAPVADYAAMGPAVTPAVTQAATTAATAAAAAAREEFARHERYREMQRALRAPMNAIMADNPWTALRAPPVPAPVSAPAPEAGVGRQSMNEGESAMFIIRTADGTDRSVRASRTDAQAIRDELNRGVAPPTWAVS